ncbi:type II toxin-antitoxin system VapC family toxin [Citrifermentans bremense]|uniref:type II toxin-antitoxin system VapC family toxin n=1 Tax=Citrifermentans bremense TaxID=60035 RepID=UPI00041CE075|nr:type II toxin-antitoxin system VapC family toxin [Citrifermentans bremense]
MARLLLDTHAFLWWLDDAPQLSAAAIEAISDADNECYLSLASCWEMAIKSSLGKLHLASAVERFVSEQLAANSFTLLNIELRHVARVQKMPFKHRDPFDRLLIAQAITEKLTIVTADKAFAEYSAKLLW